MRSRSSGGFSSSGPDAEGPRPGAGYHRAGCPWAEEVPAFLQGELSGAESARFAAHLASCPACRLELEESRALLALLESEAGSAPTADRGTVDLLPGILRRIDAAPSRPAVAARRLLLAAAILILAGLPAAIFWISREKISGLASAPAKDPPPAAAGPIAGPIAGPTAGSLARTRAAGDSAAQALEWLARAQEESGGFSAARWGGHPRYDVGLTALALLASIEGGRGESPIEERLPLGRPSVERAIAFLLREQGPEGLFGPSFPGALHNHGLATVALLEASAPSGRAELKAPLERALRYIVQRQAPEGGWGYLEEGPAASSTQASGRHPLAGPNSAMGCWPLQALLLARALGFPELDRPIRSGFERLARMVDGSGQVGYRRQGEFLRDPAALSSMGAYLVLLARDPRALSPVVRGRLLDRLARQRVEKASRGDRAADLYGEFFLRSALEAESAPRNAGGDRPSGGTLVSAAGSPSWSEESRRALAARQVREGPEAGSFDPRQEAWSAAGGRLYSTALATLILRADERERRLEGWFRRG